MCSMRGNQLNRRFAAQLPASSMLLLLTICASIAGCGGGSSSSPSTSSSSLWVANRVSNTVVSFSSAARKASGTPAATRTNESSDLFAPEDVLFDKHHNLWISNCFGSDDFNGSISEFTQSQLKQLGKNSAPFSTVLLQDDGGGDIFNCPYGLQFDKSGNLWVSNRFVPNLIAYGPDQLKQSGPTVPGTTIFYPGFGDPEDILFDKSGNLFVADVSVGAVWGFKGETLDSALGTIAFLTPDFTNESTALNGPDALAFDRNGNLWVANCTGGDLTRFKASDVQSIGAPTPDVTISATEIETGSGTALSLDCPEGLGFDSQGNLWVSNADSDTQGSLAKFTPSQLSADGSPQPAVFLDGDVAGTNLNQPVLIDFGSP